MNDETMNNQNNGTPKPQVVGPNKNDTSLPKTRVKGSHRNGKPPKLKWL